MQPVARMKVLDMCKCSGLGWRVKLKLTNVCMEPESLCLMRPKALHSVLSLCTIDKKPYSIRQLNATALLTGTNGIYIILTEIMITMIINMTYARTLKHTHTQIILTLAYYLLLSPIEIPINLTREPYKSLFIDVGGVDDSSYAV